MTVRRTGRWRGVVVVALAAAAVGVLAVRPLVLLVGVIGVIYAVYPRLMATPAPDLTLFRRVSEEAPAPGETVEVTVTVTNDGDRTLWDIRIVDGVPGMLPVIGGTPRHATVLRPGASTAFTYTIEAASGTHAFDPATVLARDPAGATEVETEVTTETRIECESDALEAPVRRQADRLPGPVTTATGGTGVEFHGVREYRSGDALSRIDWRRYAQTGELVTIEFAKERSATIVLVVDARAPAYCGSEGEPHAVARSVAAASGLAADVATSGNRVGVAAVGRTFGWLSPGSGAEHAAQARRLLAAHPACADRPPREPEGADAEAATAELRARLDRACQIVLLSPLTDDVSEEMATLLAVDGHAVTVLSPDVTDAESIGGRLARVERANRVAGLRKAGMSVIDWSTDEPLGVTLDRSRVRAVA